MAGANKSRPGSDEMQPFVRTLPWNAESLGISALLGKYHGPFDFLPEFHLPFGFSMQDGSTEKFIASAISGLMMISSFPVLDLITMTWPWQSFSRHWASISWIGARW